MTNVLYSLALVSAFALAGLLWRARFADRWASTSLSGVRVSWMFLLLFLFSTAGSLQRRDDLTALMTEGLSAANQFQAVVIVLGLMWALILLTSKRVKISALFAGSGFWISCLIVLYGLSSVWSEWPALTAYRTLELSVVWVAAAHIFGGERCVSRIDKFLLWTLAIYWISGLARLDPNLLSGGQVVGAIREHSGAIAAIVLLWTVYRAESNGWRRNAVRYAVSVLSLVIFGSLASALAFGAALIALKMSSFHAGFEFKTSNCVHDSCRHALWSPCRAERSAVSFSRSYQCIGGGF